MTAPLEVNYRQHGGWAATAAAQEMGVSAMAPKRSCAFTSWAPPHAFALTAEECETLIAAALDRGTSRAEASRDASWRCSTWAMPIDILDEALVGRLILPGEVGNVLWWRLGIESWHLEVKRYEPGQSHPEHIDLHPTTMTRKIAVSVQLSDPGAYVGGALQVRWGQWRDCERGQGSITAFPSWMLHRVTPVESGERWSLVVAGAGQDIQ